MRAFNTAAILWVIAVYLVQLLPFAKSQHKEGTLQHEQSVAQGEAALNEVLQTHPDVLNDYYPDKEATEEFERYRVSFPNTEDFVIGLLVNPCGAK